MSITLYGTPGCDTVKRARAWFQGQGLAVRFHDFKQQGVPPEALVRWVAELGHEALLNRRGSTWRGLDDAQRAGVHDAQSARLLMAAHPSLIKRPVVEWPAAVTVGFEPARFTALARG